MPKCRSCNNRVSSTLTWCTICGTWTPDKKKFQMKMAIVVGVAFAIGIFVFFMLQDLMNGAQQRSLMNP